LIKPRNNRIKSTAKPKLNLTSNQKSTFKRSINSKGKPKKVTTRIVDFNTDTPEAEVAIINYQLPHKFGSKVIAECKKLSKLKIDKKNRRDLRNLAFVTIDGDDAKDFDDAVFAEIIKDSQPNKKNITNNFKWRLFVAIADVSFFVEPNTAIDNEAYLRATSVYFPRLVVPMLPPILSENLCSLIPQADRPVMICEIELDRLGEIHNFNFYNGLIKSHSRLTYKQVESFLFNKSKFTKNKNLTNQVQNNLVILKDIYFALRHQREKRGALDLDSKEYKFTFKNKKVDSIYLDDRGESNKLIEECMIAANICAAKFLENKTKTLFRVHEPPEKEKLSNLKHQLRSFGIKKIKKLGKATINSKIFAELLAKIKTNKYSEMLQHLILRSLKNAIYTPNNQGHFGLGLTHYAHFTSPIRRYPDLLVHRGIKKIIKDLENKKISQKKISRTKIHLPTERNWVIAGEHCSYCEKRADSASRDANMMLRCELAKKDLGDALAASVSGITKFGIFVQLERSYADGLVPIKAISRYYDDYIEFDEANKCLYSPRNRKTIRLCAKVIVRIHQIDSWDRKMELELIKIYNS